MGGGSKGREGMAGTSVNVDAGLRNGVPPVAGAKWLVASFVCIRFRVFLFLGLC
jgi:hypothetical protein